MTTAGFPEGWFDSWAGLLVDGVEHGARHHRKLRKIENKILLKKGIVFGPSPVGGFAEVRFFRSETGDDYWMDLDIGKMVVGNLGRVDPIDDTDS